MTAYRAHVQSSQDELRQNATACPSVRSSAGARTVKCLYDHWLST
jgi:hypothetical protein